MLAGNLDRTIFLDRPVVTQNGLGEEITTWVQIARRRASWRRATSNETLASAEIAATVTDIFEIRWSADTADLDAKCQLTYGQRIYDIVSVEEIGRREGQRINAAARAD